MRLGDLDALKSDLKQYFSDGVLDSVSAKIAFTMVLRKIDNAPTVFSCNACKNMGNERECVDCHDYSNYVHYEERPQGECRTCRHRDPKDKKCDCGGQERQGCPFPVSDDYFCKFYEKGGAE